MLSVLMIAIAAMLNSVMDLTENENFSRSIFSKRNPDFWYKRVSWEKAKKIFRWKYDAWHVAKSLMLLFIILAIVLYEYFPLTAWAWYLDIPVAMVIMGTSWILTFNIFYNKVFILKNQRR